MYNVVKSKMHCAECGEVSVRSVQFCYGNLRGWEYEVGDCLTWGVPQEGDATETYVVVRGLSSCPKCRARAESDIFVRDGRVQSVEPSSGRYDFCGVFYTVLSSELPG
jgi:hypothetical protein